MRNILLIIVACIIYSCGSSDYENHIKEFKECAEKKQKEKNYKYSNIQEALNAYDFEVARAFLACHPTKDFFYKDSGKRSDKNRWTESPYQKDLEQIVTAEITYFVQQGEFKKAEAAAKEADMIEFYTKFESESFENKIDEMVEKREFKKIHDYLVNKRVIVQKITYDLSCSSQGSCKKGNASDHFSITSNPQYNFGVKTFNALLDKVLIKYIYLKVEKDEIISIIELALPELVNKNDKRESDGSKLSDIYKKEATAKYLK